MRENLAEVAATAIGPVEVEELATPAGPALGQRARLVDPDDGTVTASNLVAWNSAS